MAIPLSVVILTKDEEINLPQCLDSLYWCDDILVVDSGSTDNTVAIARGKKVPCIYHPFVSFAQQRNWAIDYCQCKYEWILFLDADERSTPAFEKDISAALSSAGDSNAGYYCCPKTMFNGRWLKRADSFPKWQFRILRLGRARFIDYGHGQKEGCIKGELGYIQGPYIHYPFHKGWDCWRLRHKRYIEEEAKMKVQEKINLRDLFSQHSSMRNKALKLLVSILPGWPLFRFLYDYVFKMGFLEGYPAFLYCANIAWYEFFIQVKMIKLWWQ